MLSRVLICAGILVAIIYLVTAVEVSTDGRAGGSLPELTALSTRDDINLLFILVDTLRADRLSAYGYDRDTSPVLSELAADGVRFANHLAQSSWTKTSMASLWTGLYPIRASVLRYPDAVAEEARMPAEILQDAGFYTAGIFRNGWVSSNFGFSQGFDLYSNPSPMPLPRGVDRPNPGEVSIGSDRDILLSALDFIRVSSDRRWFLYLHLMDIHQYVYDEDSALFGTSYSDIYDNSIRRTDRLIGVLLDELAGRRLRGRTIVVIASDHGEAFNEHGAEGHGRNLYSEVTHTPWIISFPFRISGGLIVDTPTENVDIWPTILAFLGLPDLPVQDGRSVLREIEALLAGDVLETSARPRFAHLDQTWGQVRARPRPLIAVTEGNSRLMVPITEPTNSELYDLDEDPGELSNLAGHRPGEVERLRSLAHDYHGRPAAWGDGPPQVELDEMTLKQLRALGYKIE